MRYLITTPLIICLLTIHFKLQAQFYPSTLPEDLTSQSIDFQTGDYARTIYCNCDEFIEIKKPNYYDSINALERKNFKNAIPSKENYHKYYNTALSLSRLQDSLAEQMLTNIIESNLAELFDTAFYKKNNRVENNRIEKNNKIGIVISEYKYTAALELTRIYLNKNKPQEALSCLQRADTLYKNWFSFFTKESGYLPEMNCLYRSCYYKLKRYKDVIELSFNGPLYKWNELSDSALYQLYSQHELDSIMQEALDKIIYRPDSTLTLHVNQYREFADNKVYTDSIWYKSITAEIKLFGYPVVWKPDLSTIRYINGENAVVATEETALYALKREIIYRSFTRNRKK